MTVSSVSGLQKSALATDPTSSTPIVSGPKTLGSEDFMKLLAVQFEQQDPMQPMDDTAFIAQMAQFTSLSQTQAMTTQITQMAANQSLAGANSYIGYQVTVDNGDGTSSSGVVSSVQINNGTPQIMVGGNPYSISSVLLVQPSALGTTSGAADGSSPATVPAPVSTPVAIPANTTGGS